MATSTDYDAPRSRPDDDLVDPFLGSFASRRNDARSSMVDGPENDASDTVVDVLDHRALLDDQAFLPVVAKRGDEFTCARCFMVYQRTRAAKTSTDQTICRDCG